MTPLNGYVIIKPKDKNKESADEITKRSGIIIPDDAGLESDNPIEVGEVLYSDDERVKKGDWVMFNTFQGLDYLYQDKQTWAIHGKSIIAKL